MCVMHNKSRDDVRRNATYDTNKAKQKAYSCVQTE